MIEADYLNTGSRSFFCAMNLAVGNVQLMDGGRMASGRNASVFGCGGPEGKVPEGTLPVFGDCKGRSGWLPEETLPVLELAEEGKDPEEMLPVFGCGGAEG